MLQVLITSAPKSFSPALKFFNVRIILLLITALVLLYGVIYPNFAVVTSSFQQNGQWTLANYREVLSQRFVIEAILTSLVLSVATVMMCAGVGLPLAFLFERYTF